METQTENVNKEPTKEEKRNIQHLVLDVGLGDSEDYDELTYERYMKLSPTIRKALSFDAYYQVWRLIIGDVFGKKTDSEDEPNEGKIFDASGGIDTRLSSFIKKQA